MTAKMRRICGFTLIDIMVTITIITILASIAIPNYQKTVRRSMRAQARATLFSTAQLEERYFTMNNSYQCFNSTGCTSTPTGWQNYSGSSYASRKYDKKHW